MTTPQKETGPRRQPRNEQTAQAARPDLDQANLKQNPESHKAPPWTPHSDQPQNDERRIELPPFIDANAMLAAPAEPEPPLLVHGILHQGLKAMLAGASKSMKS